MNRESQISDSLLVKYILLEASPEEKLQVEQWLAQSEANEREFQQFLLIWAESKKLEKNSNRNVETGWQHFQQKIHNNPPGKTIPLSGRTFNWMRMAAIFLVMIGISSILYYTAYDGRMLTVSASGAVVAETLPDGTKVTLNKGAILHYPKAFSGNTREITLEGEAFFDVSHDKTKPFIIHANEADVRVVGTSFNVKTNSNITEVIVETGIVRVSKQQIAVTLNPKEKATVKKNLAQPIKESEDDELYNYYRTKEFVCNGTPLKKLIAVLNDAYSVNIVIENEDKKELPLTTTFKNDSLDDILTVISGTFNIKIEKREGIIILK